MISPFTKPGSKVVCVDAMVNDARYGVPGVTYQKVGLGVLSEGQIYTVLSIVGHPASPEGCVVILAEIRRTAFWPRSHSMQGFSLRRFRPLVLPECLTSLLHTQPHDLEVVS